MTQFAACWRLSPTVPGIAGEEDAKGGIVVELDDVLGAPACPSAPVKNPAAESAIAEQVAHCPLGESQHSPPLAEDDDLATLLDHELPDELAQLETTSARRVPRMCCHRGAGFGSWARGSRIEAGPCRWR